MTEQASDWRLKTGDELLLALSALANPHRLRIIASLSSGRNYVSQLARDIQMSRPLLHMHLQRLEAAGLIRGTLELSQEDGKAMKYYEVTPFALTLTPASIARLVTNLSSDSSDKKEVEK
jgi:predicted transcriptional regulator